MRDDQAVILPYVSPAVARGIWYTDTGDARDTKDTLEARICPYC